MLRMRRFIVSTLQFCLLAISSSEKPSALIFRIVFSSSVKPHSAMNFSRSAVGNCSFAFLPGVVRSDNASIGITASQSVKKLLCKIF